MAIVQAGKQFTADDLRATAGRLASGITASVQASDDFRVQLETWPDADLVILGLTQDQINAIKGFFVGDLPGIRNLAQASTWIKQLLGTGV